MILTLHVIDEVVQVTGPCSRIFQATSADLAIAVSTIERCKSTSQARRADRGHFETVCQRARQFAEMHGIDPVLTQQLRRKKRRRYADGSSDARDDHLEKSEETQQQEEEDNFYVNVYLTAMDSLLVDLASRYGDNILPVVRQMMVFSAGNLQTMADIMENDVNVFCEKYCLDSRKVVRELNSFKPIFKDNHHLVCMMDVISKSNVHESQQTQECDATGDRWIQYTFLQPYRLLHQLSGFPMLLTVYKVCTILCRCTVPFLRMQCNARYCYRNYVCLSKTKGSSVIPSNYQRHMKEECLILHSNRNFWPWGLFPSTRNIA